MGILIFCVVLLFLTILAIRLWFIVLPLIILCHILLIEKPDKSQPEKVSFWVRYKNQAIIPLLIAGLIVCIVAITLIPLLESNEITGWFYLMFGVGSVAILISSNPKNEPQTDEKPDSTITVSSKFKTKSDYNDYSRFFQKWDKNYNKDLGYEWFRVCVEIVKFPIYNSIDSRLTNVRKKLGITQANAARMANISVSALSSYENGYTSPSSSSLFSLSNVYGVPVEFLKLGFVKYLSEHIELCMRFGEDEYIHSLSLAVTAASRLFPEMLTQEDKGIVILVNDILNLKLDLFNEEAIAKENLQNEIKSEIMKKLNEGEVNQRELYAYYEENRYIAQKIVKELFHNGIITKEKIGNTFLLKLSNSTNNNDKGANNE